MIGLTKNYTKAIYEWLSQFASTYREPVNEKIFNASNPKPKDYITFYSTSGNFGATFIQPISIYSKSTSYNHVATIADAIESAIGEHGIRLNKSWGILTIYKGSPFYQDKGETDQSYKAGYINLEVTIYQKNV